MRKLWLIGLLGLVLVACDVSNPPVPDSDLTAQACSPVISMDRVMQLLNDTRDARGRALPQSQWVTAGAIAKAESGLCVRAYNGNNANGSRDRGLFQINSVHRYSTACLYNESCNVQAAIAIYSQNNNWRPWSVYKRGSYRRYLSEAQAAFDRVISSNPIYNSKVFNWRYYLGKYPDLRRAGLTTEAQARAHWRDYGLGENRRGLAKFHALTYYNRYPDLRRAFTNRNLTIRNTQLVTHYLNYGIKEGRSGE